MTDLIQNTTDETKAVFSKSPEPNLSMAQLIRMINLARLKHLSHQSNTQLSELKQRQKDIEKLHNLQKALNKATESSGVLDFTKNQELKDLIDEARKLGVDIAEGKTKFNDKERERLLDNIRMTIEDIKVKNDMQLQAVNRLMSELHESIQFSRSLLKTLHEMHVNRAYAMKPAAH